MGVRNERIPAYPILFRGRTSEGPGVLEAPGEILRYSEHRSKNGVEVLRPERFRPHRGAVFSETEFSMNTVSRSRQPRIESATRSSTGRSIAYVAVFAALVAVLGLPGSIPLPGLVPITAQTLGVMLAGAILGPLRGAASMLLFLVLVAIGLPLLSGGRGGLGVFVGPSAGYLVSWILGAAVIGWVMRSGNGRPTWAKSIVGCLLGGIVAIYAVGIPVQAAVTGMSIGQAAISSLAFIPGDLIKLVIACLVTMSLWKAYPRAFQR